MRSRFPVAFRPPAFASWSSFSRWGIGSPSRSAYRHRRQAPDPNGVVVLHMSKTRPDRAPSLPRGRRCVPGRRLSSGRHPPLFQRPVPYGPARTSHRRGSPSRSVIEGSLTFTHHPGRLPPPGLGACRLPPVFSSPVLHRAERQTLGFYPELRTPQSPTTHVEAETGRTHWPEYDAFGIKPKLQAPPTSTHAPSRRT